MTTENNEEIPSTDDILKGLVHPTGKFIEDPQGMIHHVYDAREVDAFIEKRMEVFDRPFKTLLKKYNQDISELAHLKRFYNQVILATQDESLQRALSTKPSGEFYV